MARVANEMAVLCVAKPAEAEIRRNVGAEGPDREVIALTVGEHRVDNGNPEPVGDHFTHRRRKGRIHDVIQPGAIAIKCAFDLLPDAVVGGKADIGLAVDVGRLDLLFRREAMARRGYADKVAAA